MSVEPEPPGVLGPHRQIGVGGVQISMVTASRSFFDAGGLCSEGPRQFRSLCATVFVWCGRVWPSEGEPHRRALQSEVVAFHLKTDLLLSVTGP